MQVGCACKRYPSPSLDGDTSIRFQNKGIYNKQGKTMNGSFGIKTSQGRCVCTRCVWECGAVRIPSTILKKELWVRLIPAQSTMKFVIRLCASEVDRKSIHSDVYHEGRWLLWYLIFSQTITMQSVHTPYRPPPAAETTLNNNLTIREYCFGTETARAKSGEHLKV